jgi:hypothetical protein
VWVLNDPWLAAGTGIRFLVRVLTSFDASKGASGAALACMAVDVSTSEEMRWESGEVVPGIFVVACVFALHGCLWFRSQRETYERSSEIYSLPYVLYKSANSIPTIT